MKITHRKNVVRREAKFGYVYSTKCHIMTHPSAITVKNLCPLWAATLQQQQLSSSLMAQMGQLQRTHMIEQLSPDSFLTHEARLSATHYTTLDCRCTFINKSESLFICKTELWEQILVNLQTTFVTQSISLTSEVCIEVCCSPPGARVAVLVVLVLVGAPLQVPEPLHGLHPLSVVWVTKTHFNYLVLRPHHLTWVQVIHLCAPVVLALPVQRPVAVLPLPPLGHHVSLNVGGLQHIALI